MSREFRDPLASSADRSGEGDTPNSNRLFNRSAVYGALSSGAQDSSVNDAVQFFTGFDVVASSAVQGDRSKHGSTAAELSHIELLEGFFPALAKAVKADSERRERALQKRRAARDRHGQEVCCMLICSVTFMMAVHMVTCLLVSVMFCAPRQARARGMLCVDMFCYFHDGCAHGDMFTGISHVLRSSIRGT
jgi:hypothetical protein